MVKRVLLAFLVVGVVRGQVAAPAGGTSVCKVIEPDAMDGPIASPENHTVLYEDRDVRVLDVHSAPHTQEKMHTHARPAVMYIDSQGAGRYFTPEDMVGRSHPTDPNFKFRIFALKPEGLHATENTGEVPFHAIRVEFKHPGCSLDGAPVKALGPDDAVTAAPDFHTVIFENEDVRVLDVHSSPHAKEPMHTHAWPSFFYVVQDQPSKFFTPTQTDPKAMTFPAGMKIVAVGPTGLHWVENVGDGPTHYIRFELKHATPGEQHFGKAKAPTSGA
jgi:hypothetical protein